jgi:hypothetical protein
MVFSGDIRMTRIFVHALLTGIFLALTLSTNVVASEEDEPTCIYGGADWSHAIITDRPERLKGILGKKRGANRLELSYGEKFGSNWSFDTLASIQRNGDMIIGSALGGVRYDVSAFPKTFFTPWAGAYLSFDHLDDRSNVDENVDGEEDWDGLGRGVAWRAGLSMRVGKQTALQLSYSRTKFGALGFTENFRAYAGEFTGEQYSLLLIMYAIPDGEEITFEEEAPF